MYEAFFGLKEKPFSMLPDPGFLFLSKKHQAALTLLEYGLLNHVGFCVISGEAGAGKTTILRALLERVDDNVTVGLITNTHQSFGGLLDWVLSAFDLHQPHLTQVEMHQIFMEFLIAEYANNRTTLLIVDEAQNMLPDTLEELRMLSNVNSEKDQLMQVVLAGQPALKETLRQPELMQFAQRIAVDYHLDSLNLKETCGYIQHRLKTAGAVKDVFTPAACERIHCYSGGTPRLINLLCETVMVYGFADQQELIDIDLVDEMVQERMRDSVVPIFNRDAVDRDNTEVCKELEKDFPWIVPDEDKSDVISEDTSSIDKLSQALPSADPDETSTEASETDDVSGVTSAPDVADTDTAIAAESMDHGVIGGTEINAEAEGTPEVADETASDVNENTDDNVRGKEARGKQRALSPEVSALPQETEQTVAERSPGGEKTKGDSRKQFFKYGAVAAVIAVILIVAAFVLSEDKRLVTEPSPDKEETTVKKLQSQQEAERIKQLQIEAEALKKERDAAIAKAEEEKRAKEEAEKAEKAAEKKAEEVRKAAESKRVAAARKKEKAAQRAAKKARAEAASAKRETARLAEEKRVAEEKLAEEQLLKKQAEIRRQEFERLEAKRQELREAEIRAAERAAADEAARVKAAKDTAAAAELEQAKTKSDRADCSGPTARFKSGCR